MSSTESSVQLHQQVADKLATFQHATLHQNLLELNALRAVQLQDHILTIQLVMPFAWQQALQALQQQLNAELLALTQAKKIEWQLSYQIATLKRANQQPTVKNIKNIIAVSSGKGGVGKSSTAVNLALALQQSGCKVGILDADIYGPSIPLMMGAQGEHPVSPDNQHMAPIMAHNMPTNSIGYLVDDDSAMIWRGPMASKALLQILNDTLWPQLDYLVIDMPPGTGDIQLALAQAIPVTGAVIVTTPQDVALVDAAKGITMFNKVAVPVAGIMENMSYHICANCGQHEAIFGEGGAAQLVQKYQTKLLGQIPLHRQLRQDLDDGVPTLIRDPQGEFSQLYQQIAELITAELYWQGQVIPDEIAIRAL